MCFHAGGDVNCSSVHYSGHLWDGLGWFQDERPMLRHQRWNLEGILFDILKYPLSGNERSNWIPPPFAICVCLFARSSH